MNLKTLDEMEVTPELLEAIEEQRVTTAKRVKEASLGAKVPKIIDYALQLATTRGHQSKKQVIQRINKECVKWLKEESTW